MRKARFRVSVRDLIIATAILALMLGHLTYLLRARPRRHRVTIRVFNRTRDEIGFLRYQWESLAGLVESHGENSGVVSIVPGGMKTFRVDLPGPVDFTLSCTTGEDHMTSGPVQVDVGGGHPDSLDFIVRPSAVAVRRTTGSGSRGQGRPGEKVEE